MGKVDKQKKKETRQIVFAKLSGVMEEYRNNFKEKRFKSKLKKVSRMFADDIIKATAKSEKLKNKEAASAQENIAEPVITQ